ncbi:MAG: 50S ribosomal protein L13 [Acidobacteriota bacterium]
MPTTFAKASTVNRKWLLVDADGATLGRLSTWVARALMGKHRPEYTPYLDTGDFVVVVNASKVRMTGRKLEQKKYRWHTGYPGGLKEVEAARMLQEHPDRIIESSVRGMLPKGPLGKSLGKKLKVYAGPEHPHEAQQPEKITIPA